MTAYVVAAYEIGQAYGGPEEGGWWYGTGDLVRPLRVFKDRDKASAYCRRVNRSLGFKFDLSGARPVSSVAYEGGYIAAEVHEGTAPESYPRERPYYE